jgi:propane monooxygenase reductase subunit
MVDAALLFLEAQGVPGDQVFHDSFTSPVTVTA